MTTDWKLIPISIALTMAVILFMPLGTALAWVCSLPFHESGHTIILWLRGIPAVPTPFMTISFTEKFSWFGFLVVSGLAGLLYWQGKLKKNTSLVRGAYTLAFLFVMFSVVFSTSVGEQVMLAAGLGGETVLAAVALILVHCELPFPNWQQNRYVFLVAGALSFSNSGLRWIKASFAAGNLPMGALIDVGLVDGEESSGDLDRLIREFAWNRDKIVTTNMTILVVTSFLLLIAVYVLATKERPKSAKLPSRQLDI